MKKHILLIDDDRDEQMFFVEALETINAPYDCLQATGLEQALQIIKLKSPELIFLDYNMPMKNGLDCMKEIRKQKKLPPGGVYLYTTHIDMQMKQRLTKLGAQDCIVKPSSISELAEVLREVLPAATV